MKSIIDVKNLSFRYKESQEYYDVKDITFHVKRGEWLSIVGHNGSGKSTTVRLIDGLLEAESGEIVIDGQRLTEENIWNIRRQIGMVFQNPDNQFDDVYSKHFPQSTVDHQLQSLQILLPVNHQLIEPSLIYHYHYALQSKAILHVSRET